MRILRRGDRQYAQFPILRGFPGLIHAYGVRPLDVSPKPGPATRRRDAARAAMIADFFLEPQRLFYCRQVHETRIAVIDEHTPPGPQAGYDALITATPGAGLMTFSADCPLVVIYDPRRQVVGLAHMSWRCTVGRLSQHVIEQMQTRFGAAPADLRAGIGPGAGVCCYEVGEDVHTAAADLPDAETHFQHRAGRLYLDLASANTALLQAAGVPAGHIERANLCTMCRTDLFYSYRCEGPDCGHFGLLAALTAGA